MVADDLERGDVLRAVRGSAAPGCGDGLPRCAARGAVPGLRGFRPRGQLSALGTLGGGEAAQGRCAMTETLTIQPIAGPAFRRVAALPVEGAKRRKLLCLLAAY